MPRFVEHELDEGSLMGHEKKLDWVVPPQSVESYTARHWALTRKQYCGLSLPSSIGIVPLKALRVTSKASDSAVNFPNSDGIVPLNEAE